MNARSRRHAKPGARLCGLTVCVACFLVILPARPVVAQGAIVSWGSRVSIDPDWLHGLIAATGGTSHL